MRAHSEDPPIDAVRHKWQDVGAGMRYASQRWKSSRAALRDPLLVERILDRHSVRPSLRPILDAPCGTGRLRGVLERRGIRYVGIDVSPAMLEEARHGSSSGLCRAAIERLPFRDDSFDVVICCRLLHHIHEPEDVQAIVHQLVRVSYRMVIASFWDSASLHAWRRRVGLRRTEGQRGRRAISKRNLRRIFQAAGADVVGYHHSLRFVSQQAFVVAVKRAPVDERARGVKTLQSRILDLDLQGASGSLGGA
jgi:SAM-dependent methyltransferase